MRRSEYNANASLSETARQNRTPRPVPPAKRVLRLTTVLRVMGLVVLAVVIYGQFN